MFAGALKVFIGKIKPEPKGFKSLFTDVDDYSLEFELLIELDWSYP